MNSTEQTASWPARLAVAEGFANARTGRWVSVLLVLATAGVIGGTGLANALEVSDLVRAERVWIDAGARTVVVEPGKGDDAVIDIATCDRLSGLDGITGAFAVTTTRSAATPVGAPGVRATVTHVSPGIFTFFDLDAPTGAVVVATPATLEPLGLIDGDRTTLNVTSHDGTGATSGRAVHVTTVDSLLLGDDLAGTWMLPDLQAGGASSCYVTSDAAHLSAVQAYLPEALAADDGTPAVVRPRLFDTAYDLDFSTAFSGRPLTWAWAASAMFLTVLWAAVSWTRRSRLAVYATFGAHPRARLVLQLTEWIVLSSVAAAWGWASAVSLGIGLGADPATVAVHVTGHAVATWASATVGVIAVGMLPVGTLLDALKDRS